MNRGRLNAKVRQHHRRCLCLLLLFCLALGGCAQSPDSPASGWLAELGLLREESLPDASAFLDRYASLLLVNDFGGAYALLSGEAQDRVTLTDYAQRHSPIFEALDLTGISYTPVSMTKNEDGTYLQTVKAVYSCDLFGSFTQDLEFSLTYSGGGFALNWEADDLFAGLTMGDSLRLSTLRPKRGEILDADHNQYAVNAYADTVYLRLEDYEEDEPYPVVELASLLEMEQDEVEKILHSERSVADGLAILKVYAPLSLPETTESALMTLKGVGVDRSTYTPVRYYPQGSELCHALGYVSPVTAEDMEASPGTYEIGSMVGRTGLEAVYEDRLRGTKGYSLDIYDANGQKQQNVALLPAQDGLDLEIGIDLDLQDRAEELLTELAPDNAGAIVVLDPTTGQVEAMASYPNFDPNLFVLNTDPETVASYYDEESNNPLYNRATQGLYPPGSTIKPLIAAMALDNNIVSPEDEFPGSIVKNKWTPRSYGEWFYPAITRVSDYDGAINMSNAITHSDNIYFAWLALESGWDVVEPFMQSLGFGEKLPFDLRVSVSSYLNNGDYENKRLLANTGYGQGEVLVSPLQMGAVFSSFANECNVMVPRLVTNLKAMNGDAYEVVEAKEPSVWKENIYSSYARSTIEPMLRRVVTEGSGRRASIDGLTVCGKTGTAEIGSIKAREIAWFIAYLEDADYDRLVCVALEVPADWTVPLRYDAVHELLMP